jgi:ubiquinone/menaquinone biosynthesis C-methylase UbiE
MIKFQSFFSHCTSIEHCKKQAAIDWKYRFKNFEPFEKIDKDLALEIGYGGGRLIAECAKDFKKVIGIDIHSENIMVENYLHEECDVNNYQLLNVNKKNRILDNSVDYIYSFIVFQHFKNYKLVIEELLFIKRILKPRGICHIYFAKTNDKQTYSNLSIYEERERNMFINPSYFRKDIGKYFSIIDYEDKVSKSIIDNKGEAGQAMVIFTSKEK